MFGHGGIGTELGKRECGVFFSLYADMKLSNNQKIKNEFSEIFPICKYIPKFLVKS